MSNQATDGGNAGLFYACVMACFSIAMLVLALPNSAHNEKKSYFFESKICSSRIESFLIDGYTSHDERARNSEKDILDICLQMRAVSADEKSADYVAKSYILIIIGSILLGMATIAAAVATWLAKGAIEAASAVNEIARETS